MSFPSFFPRMYRPAIYQGKKNPERYFEGWYYKHVDPSGKEIWAIIFGISYSEDAHSFIQVIEGRSGKTDYIRFPKEDFKYSRKKLHVRIGENEITDRSVLLDVAGKQFRIKGRIDYSDTSPFPQSFLSPGIMGWYSFVPLMECYHGVVSMNHTLQGQLEINSKIIDFSGGKGYVEKDWGRSMPSDWIWIQCNDFDQYPEVSLMVSVARIPWFRGYFPGFLSFLKTREKVYRFATYNRSDIESLRVEKDRLDLVLVNRTCRLDIEVERNISGTLKAPVQGEMSRKIAESLDARMKVVLTGPEGHVILSAKGSHAGLEIVGDIAKYLHPAC